jgi:hypothetical protein
MMCSATCDERRRNRGFRAAGHVRHFCGQQRFQKSVVDAREYWRSGIEGCASARGCGGSAGFGVESGELYPMGPVRRARRFVTRPGTRTLLLTHASGYNSGLFRECGNHHGVPFMYAVIKTGGKQYKVAPGEKLK